MKNLKRFIRQLPGFWQVMREAVFLWRAAWRYEETRHGWRWRLVRGNTTWNCLQREAVSRQWKWNAAAEMALKHRAGKAVLR